MTFKTFFLNHVGYGLDAQKWELFAPKFHKIISDCSRDSLISKENDRVVLLKTTLRIALYHFPEFINSTNRSLKLLKRKVLNTRFNNDFFHYSHGIESQTQKYFYLSTYFLVLSRRMKLAITEFRNSYGEGNGSPLQCSCLENPGRAWWAAIYGVAQSWTRLKRLSSSSSMLSNLFQKKKKKIPKELNSWKQNIPLRGEYNNSRNLKLEYWVCIAYQCIPNRNSISL